MPYTYNTWTSTTFDATGLHDALTLRLYNNMNPKIDNDRMCPSRRLRFKGNPIMIFAKRCAK